VLDQGGYSKYSLFFVDMPHIEMVYELIDVDHELIHSIFEVYEFTKDKMDFIENLKIVYDCTYRQKNNEYFE